MILLLAFVGLVSPAQAAPFTVRVVDVSGRPVGDAVVTVRPAAGARPMKVGRAFTVTQKNLQFHPFVMVVPAGATVSFPNLDSTKHHVYSFSPAKTFELKLFAKDQSRSVRFDRPGVIALGCNIHDSMSAFIIVTDSAWTATSDSKGFVRFPDLPGSAAAMTIWHPYLRAPGSQISRPLPAGETSEVVAVRLRPPPMHDMSGY
ncbi:MAG: methylamine utilization protein [Sphingomicrobium sp.]